MAGKVGFRTFLFQKIPSGRRGVWTPRTPWDASRRGLTGGGVVFSLRENTTHLIILCFTSFKNHAAVENPKRISKKV
jgi:hypothetical protein